MPKAKATQSKNEDDRIGEQLTREARLGQEKYKKYGITAFLQPSAATSMSGGGERYDPSGRLIGSTSGSSNGNGSGRQQRQRANSDFLRNILRGTEGFNRRLGNDAKTGHATLKRK